MSREDLKAGGDSLDNLSPSSVQDFYERAYQQCRISDRGFPSARALQELVQAWKQLRIVCMCLGRDFHVSEPPLSQCYCPVP